MTKESLRQLIREMVQEEVRAALPQVMSEIFSSKLNQKVITSNQTVKPVSGSSTPSTPVVSHKREYKKYTSNELLNKALNETVGGVPNEGSMVTSGLNVVPSIMDNIEKTPPVIAQVLTKNYSALMKAIDKKKSGGTTGSGSVSMM
jgi:uncharacterized membrane protein YheB (UPF0754 family)